MMSFEYYGGILALDLLSKELNAPIEQAESVAEAVFRHQDIGKTGTITTIGQLLQLATIFGKAKINSTNAGKVDGYDRQHGGTQGPNS